MEQAVKLFVGEVHSEGLNHELYKNLGLEHKQSLVCLMAHNGLCQREQVLVQISFLTILWKLAYDFKQSFVDINHKIVGLYLRLFIFFRVPLGLTTASVMISLVLLFSVFPDDFEIMAIRIFAISFERCLIVVKTIVKCVSLLKNFAKVLIVDFFKALAKPESQELSELGQLFIQFWKSRVLPDFLNLLKWKETVTVFIVQVQIVEKIHGLFANHSLQTSQTAIDSQLVVERVIGDVVSEPHDQRLAIYHVVFLNDLSVGRGLRRTLNEKARQFRRLSIAKVELALKD